MSPLNIGFIIGGIISIIGAVITIIGSIINKEKLEMIIWPIICIGWILMALLGHSYGT